MTSVSWGHYRAPGIHLNPNPDGSELGLPGNGPEENLAEDRPLDGKLIC
jgi:hypothetical protein